MEKVNYEELFQRLIIELGLDKKEPEYVQFFRDRGLIIGFGLEDVAKLKVLINRATPKRIDNGPFGPECPACSSYLENDVNTDYYCPQCGQAIDWSDDEHGI